MTRKVQLAIVLAVVSTSVALLAVTEGVPYDKVSEAAVAFFLAVAVAVLLAVSERRN